MHHILVVGLGGFIGSIARYVTGLGVQHLSAAHSFPLGTLTVNVAGCLLIGLVGGWMEQRGGLTTNGYLFLVVGVLGGFTTFSAFGYEAFQMMKDARFVMALGHVMIHVVLGLSAVALGFILTTHKA